MILFAFAALLTFNVNPAYQCETYRWYLENTNPFTVHQIYKDGLSNSAINEPGGNVDSSIKKAWATQSDGAGILIVVLGGFNDTKHTFECAEVVRSCFSNSCVSVLEMTDTNRNIYYIGDVIQKAVDLNPDVICLPLSNGSMYESWFQGISNGMLKGIPFICAAPNVDAEVTSDYPALWKFVLTNIFVVSGQRIDDIPIFAWSTNLVDTHAPSRRLQLTDTTFGSGTSYGSSIEAGVAGLIAAKYGRSEVLTRLSAVDIKPAYAGKSTTGGTLNAELALWNPTLHIEKTNVSSSPRWYVWYTNSPSPNMRFKIEMNLVVNDTNTWFTPPSINFDDAGKTSILIPASQPMAYFRGRIVRTR